MGAPPLPYFGKGGKATTPTRHSQKKQIRAQHEPGGRRGLQASEKIARKHLGLYRLRKSPFRRFVKGHDLSHADKANEIGGL
jgi:hypothetical protein